MHISEPILLFFFAVYRQFDFSRVRSRFSPLPPQTISAKRWLSTDWMDCGGLAAAEVHTGRTFNFHNCARNPSGHDSLQYTYLLHTYVMYMLLSASSPAIASSGWDTHEHNLQQLWEHHHPHWAAEHTTDNGELEFLPIHRLTSAHGLSLRPCWKKKKAARIWAQFKILVDNVIFQVSIKFLLGPED